MKKVLMIIYLSLTFTTLNAEGNNNQIITKPINKIKTIISAISWGSITVEPSLVSDSIKISWVYDNSNKNEINNERSLGNLMAIDHCEQFLTEWIAGPDRKK